MIFALKLPIRLTPIIVLDGLGPLIYLCVAPVLFITSPLTALFKTIVDVFTRKPSTDAQLSTMKEAVKGLDQEQMNTLTSTLKGYAPQSNASKILLRRFSELDRSEEQSSALALQKIKQEQFLDQLECQDEAEALRKFGKPYVKSMALDSEHESRVAQGMQVTTERLSEDTLEAQKEAIDQYLNRDLNNGKKTMQIIQSFFARKSTEVSDDESSASSLRLGGNNDSDSE